MVDTAADIYRYERYFAECGYHAICGVDEAGRGPLAGPVVAAAVVLPSVAIPGIYDSKKLSEKKRLALLPVILEHAQVGIGVATHDEIDDINILQATFLAMRRAVSSLPEVPDMALVDGNLDPCLGISTRAIVGGDAQSASIGAASIVAKCTRDKMMVEAHEIYSEYNFAKHKGYPTKEHYEAIAANGPCPIHRMSFLKPKKARTAKRGSGAAGEKYAAAKLLDAGYNIAARNYRARVGEIDIVAVKGDIIAFVEVRTRAANYIASPAQTVDLRKQQRIIKAAHHYMWEHPTPLQPRFDVFEVITAVSGYNVERYNHIEGAFDVHET